MMIELPEEISTWLQEYQANADEQGLSDFVAESVVHDLQGSRAFLTRLADQGQQNEWFVVRPIAETFEWYPDVGPVRVAELTTEQLQEVIQSYRAFSEWLALHARELETVLEERASDE